MREEKLWPWKGLLISNLRLFYIVTAMMVGLNILVSFVFFAFLLDFGNFDNGIYSLHPLFDFHTESSNDINRPYYSLINYPTAIFVSFIFIFVKIIVQNQNEIHKSQIWNLQNLYMERATSDNLIEYFFESLGYILLHILIWQPEWGRDWALNTALNLNLL